MANCEFINYIHSNETCLTWINKLLGFLCMLHPPTKSIVAERYIRWIQKIHFSWKKFTCAWRREEAEGRGLRFYFDILYLCNGTGLLNHRINAKLNITVFEVHTYFCSLCRIPCLEVHIKTETSLNFLVLCFFFFIHYFMFCFWGLQCLFLLNLLFQWQCNS